MADTTSNFAYICYLSLVFRLCCPLPCLLREIGKYFFWLDNFYQPIFIRAELLFHTIYCNFIQNTRFMQVFFIAGIITLFNIYKAFRQFPGFLWSQVFSSKALFARLKSLGQYLSDICILLVHTSYFILYPNNSHSQMILKIYIIYLYIFICICNM